MLFARTFAVWIGFALAASSATQADEPWIDLFDGSTLHGWTARGEADLQVIDGEIHLRAEKNVWVVSERVLADFELQVEAKVADGDHVNSGIAFRCSGGGEGRPAGYQCEIDASDRAWTGGLHAIGKGWIHPYSDDPQSIAAFLATSKGSFKQGEWNRYRIVCQGDRIRIYTNEVLTTDVRDDTFHEGFFGIQNHGGGGTNRFRRIRVRPLAATNDPDASDGSATVGKVSSQVASSSTAVDIAAEMHKIPATEPAEAPATFRLRPGFKIEMVASEPLLRDPVAIDFDENGRMFVVEFPEYNQKHVLDQLIGHGRVRVLDDTDGDGVYDRSEIYVDDLSYPSSVACYDGGVFVSAAPEILYCKDTDGDDHADIREIVYTGFGQEFQRSGQGQLNAFRWGLDNRFRVCTSFSGGAISRPGEEIATPVNVRNRAFHFDPRTLAYEAAPGGGQFGIGIDDWGREFRCRNSEPFRLIIYDDRYLARNPYLKAPSPSVEILETGKNTKLFRISEDESWRVLRTRMRLDGSFAGSNEGKQAFGFFTAATGVTIYRGDAWPDEYRGDGFVGEVANNLVFRAEFETDGVGLVARRANAEADSEAEFLASTDAWFRPVQFANGPDGALYVVDMYRELIEGASFLPAEVLKHVNVMGGMDRGRIYRIVPDDFQQRSRPQLGNATTEALVALLEHRNGWHRDTASRLLYTRQNRAAIAPLLKLVAGSKMPEARMHALCVLAGLNALDEATITMSLDDPHPRVRQHAVRLAESFAPGSRTIRDRLARAADDDDLRVRFQAAFSLGAFSGGKRDDALLRLTGRDGADPWFRLAVLTAVGNRHAALFPRFLANDRVRGTEHGRELLSELASQIGASRSADSVRSLVEAVGRLESADADLARSLIRTTALGAATPEVANQIAALGGTTAEILDDLLASARARATDDQATNSARITAIRALALLDFDEIRPIALKLLEVRQPKTVQLAAIDLLGKSSRPEVASLLLEPWRGYSPELRSQVVATLSSRGPWLDALLGALEKQQISRAEIDPARSEFLTEHTNPSVRERARHLFASSLATTSRADVVASYQPALELPGNPNTGREHFRRVCSVCHRVERIGNAIGADLKSIRNRGMPAIMLNILDPNRDMLPQFVTYIVITNDGRTHTGLIQSESANSITLRQSDNTDVTILRIDIDEMQSTGRSFMPEGLERQVDVQAMADLLVYLNSIE